MQKKLDVFILACLLLALPALAPAQEEPKEGSLEDVFMDIVDVNVVNVEVYVTDRKGNRITGLERDDFVLEVDGQPKAITNFYAVEEGEARGDGIEYLAAPEIDIADPRRLEAPPVPEEQQLHLIVYVDNLNIRPFNRNKAFRFIRQFLRAKLNPGDKVMLVSYARSMKVRHPFTADPELIASSLYELETHAGQAVHFDSDRQDILDAIYDDTGSSGNTDYYSISARVRTYAESLVNDMSFTVSALDEMVESLAGLPGRKAVLYVSDGLSMRPAEDIFYAIDQRYRDQGIGSALMEIQHYDMSREFQRLVTKSNANRVTFYTLDAAGLRTYTYLDASNATAGGGAFIDQIHFSNLQNSLVFMAQETGGFAMLNTNDFTDNLNDMAGDFSTYYSLGFTTATAESGRFHNIKVKLKDAKGKKYRIRHREGYRDKPMSTRMSEGTLAALNYGYQSNNFDAQIEIGEIEPQSRNRYLVSISVRIPIDRLSFIPQEDMHRGRLRMFIGARDDEGGLSPVQDLPIPLDIPADKFNDAQDQFFRYDIQLQMRGGNQLVAVGIHDEIGAVSGYVTRGVMVGR